MPGPLLAIGRTLGLPVAEVRGYWAQEARSIRAGTVALSIGLAATLVAGLVLGSARGPLERFPGLLVLIPAAIGVRGAIFGALTARLGTGMMTGQFTPELRRESFLGRQLESATYLSVATALLIAVVAWVASAMLGLPSIDLLQLTTVSLVGAIVSSVVMAGAAVVLTRQADRRGWDVDDVGAPMITAAGDLVGLPALIGATLLLHLPVVPILLGVLGILAGVGAIVAGWRHADGHTRRIIRESLVVLTIATVVSVLAGTVLETRAEQLLALPAVLVLIPPFIANCGSLGGILSSRLASKLHIGSVEPRRFPGRAARLDFSLTGLLALVGFTGVGIIGWAGAVLAGLAPGPPWQLLAVAGLAGLFATALILVVAYAAAVTSFRYGLDPDNHGIPIVTAAMDLLGILCLVGAIAILQVG
ncbi:MAG: magnesium transporter [Nitriliruptor sp.]|uniref:magnesium transporter n=1 Tax=Nitriliruptor sp. TaxID=2448056 RepID=UPI0034A02FC0